MPGTQLSRVFLTTACGLDGISSCWLQHTGDPMRSKIVWEASSPQVHSYNSHFWELEARGLGVQGY